MARMGHPHPREWVSVVAPASLPAGCRRYKRWVEGGVLHHLERDWLPPLLSCCARFSRRAGRRRDRRKNGGSNVPHPFAGLYNSGKHSLPVRVLAVMPAGLVPFRIAFRSHGCPILTDAVCRGGWVTHPLEAPPSQGEDGAPAPARVGLCCSAGIPAGRMPALQKVGRGWVLHHLGRDWPPPLLSCCARFSRRAGRRRDRRKNGGSNVPHPFAGLCNPGKHYVLARVLAVMRVGLVPFRIAFRSHGCPILPDAVCRGGWVTHPLEAPPSKGEDGAPAPARGGLCGSAGSPAGRMPALQRVARGGGLHRLGRAGPAPLLSCW